MITVEPELPALSTSIPDSVVEVRSSAVPEAALFARAAPVANTAVALVVSVGPSPLAVLSSP